MSTKFFSSCVTTGGLDFDNDIKTIISECYNLRLDGYMYLPKLLKKMAEILDNNISAQHIYSSTLNIPIVYTDILKDVDKEIGMLYGPEDHKIPFI